MTDTTQDPELTPRDREMMRKGYALRMIQSGAERNLVDSVAALTIPEPPAYTYSEPVPDPTDDEAPDVRRSDGQWGFFYRTGWVSLNALTDERVRALAACVPGLIPPKPVPTLWRAEDAHGDVNYSGDSAASTAEYWDEQWPDDAPHTVRAFVEVTE